MSLVTRIKEVAKSRGTSIFKLEDKLNIGRNTIHTWDKVDTSCQTLIELADELNTDARYLLKGEPTPFDFPVEQKKLLEIYDRLTPEQQTIIMDMLNNLVDQIQKGQKEKDFEITEKLLRNNTPVKDVKAYTDLDESKIKQLEEEINKVNP